MIDLCRNFYSSKSSSLPQQIAVIAPEVFCLSPDLHILVH
ncbi:hypothetical protein DYY67_0005 [Candidatus Nitrosotalea sp. TS]|nr:hypothetical protein [Candidatus Nitrosotalea sp. TS]